MRAKISISLLTLLALLAFLVTLSCAWMPVQQVEPFVYLEASGGDDTAALQAAFDTLNERYAYTGQDALVILKGTFRLSDTVYIANKYRVRVLGLDASITGGGLDASNSTYLTIDGVHLDSFYYDRGAVGGGLHLRNMMIRGDMDISGADTSVFEQVTVYGKTYIRKGVTAKGIAFRDCWLEDVDILGGVVNLQFDNTYFTGTVTVDGAYNVAFINSNWEIADPPIYINAAYGLRVEGVNFSTPAPYLIVLDTTGASYGWDIGTTTRSNPSAKLIHVVSGALQNSDLIVSSVDILVEPGAVVRNNRIYTNGTQPFSGTGLAEKNTVISSYYNTIAVEGVKLGQSICSGDFCYANTAIIKLQNAQPVTLLRLAPNVTVVYLVFDGNTSIGGAGWYFPDFQTPITPAAGTVMQFVNLSGWYWTKVQ